MMKTWRLFVLAAHVAHTLAVFSGVYVDNGKNQTVMQRGISRREKVQFEKGMLDLLGLPSTPTRTFDRLNLSASAPKFLLNLYKRLDGSGVEENLFDLKESDHRTVEESDSIITFTSRNDRKGGVRNEKIKHLWFDVSSAPIEDAVVGAELRLLKEREHIEHTNERSLTITVFQVVKDLRGMKNLTFVDAVDVASDFEGWLVFNVTSAFVSWTAFPYANHGLEISVRVRGQSEPSYKIHPKEAGLVMAARENDENLPFVVAFFKSSGKPRYKGVREVTAPKKRSKRRTAYEPAVSNYRPSTTDWDFAWNTQYCQKQSMYVSFKDLKWQDWVIAPDGYAAYFCVGLCNFPLHAHMNATNHAIMQSLVHLIDASQAPKPSCAPSQLGPMSVLYRRQDNTVIMKRFRKMVVKNCGCH